MKKNKTRYFLVAYKYRRGASTFTGNVWCDSPTGLFLIEDINKQLQDIFDLEVDIDIFIESVFEVNKEEFDKNVAYVNSQTK